MNKRILFFILGIVFITSSFILASDWRRECRVEDCSVFTPNPILEFDVYKKAIGYNFNYVINSNHVLGLAGIFMVYTSAIWNWVFDSLNTSNKTGEGK